MSEERQTVDFYETDSKVYDSSRFQDRKGLQIDNIQQAIVNELCGDVKSKKVLELAVGTGRFTKTMVSRGADLVGVDSSISMLRITRQKSSTTVSAKTPSLIRADATKLPFRENVFDYVLCINAINHMPKYTDAITESSRVLKSSGSFVFNFPSTASILLPIALLVNVRAKSIVRPVFSKWYTPKQVYITLFRNRLNVEAAEGHIPIGFAQLAIDKLVRKSPLRLFSGVLFIKAKKFVTVKCAAMEK
jgi:ubiquinone/menaquinone biosynthesis C-methylase UbiE